MNNIVNNFLIVEDKFMPEMVSKQPGLYMLLVDHLQKKPRKNAKI